MTPWCYDRKPFLKPRMLRAFHGTSATTEADGSGASRPRIAILRARLKGPAPARRAAQGSGAQ